MLAHDPQNDPLDDDAPCGCHADDRAPDVDASGQPYCRTCDADLPERFLDGYVPPMTAEDAAIERAEAYAAEYGWPR